MSKPKSRGKKSSCPECKLEVDDVGISCDLCHNWFHIDCVKIDAVFYKFLAKSDAVCWFCSACKPQKITLMDAVKSPLLDYMKVAFGELKTALLNDLKAVIDARMQPLQLSVSGIKTQLDHSLLASAALEARIVAVESKISELPLRSLECRVDNLEKSSTATNCVLDLSRTVERLDRQNRKREIIINGIPDGITDMKGFLGKLMAALELEVSPTDIDDCYRINKAGSVVVQFGAASVREIVMRRYFNKIGLKLSDVVGGDIHSRIFINDSLPPKVASLKRFCLGLKKEGRITKVSVFNERIHIICPEGRKIIVSSQEEVRRALLAEPAS